MREEGLYFHAGVLIDEDSWYVEWSPHTRRSKRAAEREALRMTRKLGGGRPIVEYWERSWGLRPGTADAVIDAYFVEKGGETS